MLKKILCGLLAGAMALTMFAGCSGEEGTASGEGGSTGTTESTGGEEGGDASGEETTLRLSLWDYETVGYDKAMVEAFQEANPNIKVDVVSTPNADYASKIAVMLSGGDEVDVFYIKSNTDYPTFVMREFVRPLSDLIEANNFDLEPYGTVLDQHYRMDGELYALPYRTNDWVLFYNKDIFDAANVPYPTNDMTWEELAEIAPQVTSGEGGSKIYGMYYQPKVSFILPFMVGYIDDYDNMTSDLSQMAYPIQYFMDLQNSGSYQSYAEAKSMSQDQTYFFNGLNAMFYDGSWFVQMLCDEESVDFEWGVAKSPYWEGTEQKGFATTTPIAINSTTEKVDAAWQLLSFLTGEEGAMVMAENKMVPGYMSDAVMETYREVTGIDDSSYEALTNNVTYGFGEPNTVQGLLTTAFQEELELAITGNQSVEQTVANMESRRTEIIEQNS